MTSVAPEPTTAAGTRAITALLGPLPIHDRAARAAALSRFTTDPAVIDEVLAAATPIVADDASLPAVRWSDEPCLTAWRNYAARAAERGAVRVLTDVLLQLQFPVAVGMDQHPAYRAATRQGIRPDAVTPPEFVDAAGVTLTIAATPVGHLPIITTSHRDDFETLVRAITHRNTPAVIPASMGACIVSGYNNWDRVARLRAAWERDTADDPLREPWREAFARLQRDRTLYQDRFVILSSGPYSAVPAEALRLTDTAWRELSHTIRREHECAHYVTRRVFGGMQAPLLDEVVADFCALVRATGSFNTDWFLRAFGLETPGACRPGGRLRNYRGTPPLSDAAFDVMQRVVRDVVATLARTDGQRTDRSSDATACMLVAITCLGLEQLSVDHGSDTLLSLYTQLRPHWPT